MPARSAYIACFVLSVFVLSAIAPAADDFAPARRDNIILFGDSITAPGDYGQIMQDLIDAKFADRQIRVLSHGQAGDTAHGGNSRADAEITAWRPAWVFINFGINDSGRYSPAAFITQYESLINRISRDTAAHIGIVSPVYPDVDASAQNKTLAAYVEGLKGLAKKYGCLYVPAYETMERLRPTLPKGAKYAMDGIHPNAIGHWMIAQAILQSLHYPFDSAAMKLEVPARWAVALNGDFKPLVGQKFTLDLPQPLEVTLTDPPRMSWAVRKLTAPIVLDGQIKEWKLENPIELGTPPQRTTGVVSWGRDHYQAKVYGAYDTDALYLAMVVDDSLVRNTPDSQWPNERDSFEVCLDMRPAAEREKQLALYGSKVANVGQVIVAPATPENPKPFVQIGTGDPALAKAVTIASTLTPTGYQIEMKIPASVFPGGKIEPGATIGMDIALNDADRVPRSFAMTQFRWSHDGAGAFFTREWGTLTLAADDGK